MNENPFKELVRELAALNEEERLRNIRESLESSLDEQGPVWLNQAFLEVRNQARAEQFAASFDPRSHSVFLEASNRLRQVRYSDEESEAATLLGLVDQTDICLPSSANADTSTEAVVLGDECLRFLPTLREAWMLTARGLEICKKARFHLVPSPEFCVSAAFEPKRPDSDAFYRLTVAAGALSLPAHELAFLLGRSLGILLYGLDTFQKWSSWPPHVSGEGSLSPEAEAVWLRWRSRADVSADRAGLLACKDGCTALRSLLTSELHLPLALLPDNESDLIALASGLGYSSSSLPESARDAGIHPLGSRGLALVKYFSAMSDEVINSDTAADEHPVLPRRHPVDGLTKALMEALAAGGLLLLAADGLINDREGRLLVRLLFREFTDHPEEVLAIILDHPTEYLVEALACIRQQGDGTEGPWLLERMLEIAKADNSISPSECSVIDMIAQALDLEDSGIYRRLTGEACHRSHDTRNSSSPGID